MLNYNFSIYLKVNQVFRTKNEKLFDCILRHSNCTLLQYVRDCSASRNPIHNIDVQGSIRIIEISVKFQFM